MCCSARMIEGLNQAFLVKKSTKVCLVWDRHSQSESLDHGRSRQRKQAIAVAVVDVLFNEAQMEKERAKEKGWSCIEHG